MKNNKLFQFLYIISIFIFAGCSSNKTDTTSKKTINHTQTESKQTNNLKTNKEQHKSNQTSLKTKESHPISYYDEILKKNPDDYKARMKRGYLFMKQEDFNKALDDFTSVYEDHPKFVPALYNKTLALLKLDRFKEALEEAKKLVLFEPDSRFFILKAQAEMHLGKYKESLKSLNDALKFAPKNFRIYMHRAEVYDTMGKFKKALLDYSEVIKINPKRITAYSRRGLIYVKMRKLKEADADFSKAIKINPEYATAYFNRGLVRYKINIDSALEDFNKALENNSKYVKAYLMRAAVYTTKKMYVKAMSDLKEAEKLNPDYGKIYLSKAIVYYNTRKLKKALKEMKKAEKKGAIIPPKFKKAVLKVNK